MTITLNHTIVPARDKRRSAEFLAWLLGLTAGEQTGPFVPVRINGELTFDFDDEDEFHAGHYAFLVDDALFDALLERLSGDTVPYGSGPEHGWDRSINHLGGGRGVYVQDPDGHSYELFTAVPVDG
ncbi:VOC family protein [Amycolatopsis pigmentata]|uniref:VOC family protein n=1 Tax=Amycolatopsis pigmentata TaxID=450801 RepID=A0ABW5FKZ9_9PSEU